MAFPLHLNSYTFDGLTFTLFEPDGSAITGSYQRGEISFPYWSQVWPAAIGLARFILANQPLIAGKKVLELAAGLGLPSLVAATAGAATVVASDYAPEAVAAMQQTIDYHHLQHVEVHLLDWVALPKNLTTEVLLLSDVSYDEQLFAIQEKVIRRLLQSGSTIIISTPQRLMAKQAIAALLPLCTHQEEITVTHQQQAVAISLFVLQV